MRSLIRIISQGESLTSDQADMQEIISSGNILGIDLKLQFGLRNRAGKVKISKLNGIGEVKKTDINKKKVKKEDVNVGNGNHDNHDLVEERLDTEAFPMKDSREMDKYNRANVFIKEDVDNSLVCVCLGSGSSQEYLIYGQMGEICFK